MSASDPEVLVDQGSDLPSSEKAVLFFWAFLFLQIDLFLELGVTSKAPPAVCSSYAKSSLVTAFGAVDDFERMSNARISSAVEQFVKDIRSGVNSPDAGMQKSPSSAADLTQTILPRMPKRYVNGARKRKRYNLASL